MQNGMPVKKSDPKDVFLHLLGVVTLYISAGSFLTLLFQYVNVWIPDVIQDMYARDSAFNAIRWGIALLIILFPVHIWTAWFLRKEFAKDPEKRDARIRKWLLYFTLFVAALIIIGDLVTLLYNFLQGELTTRFILKVIAVLFVAGAIFFYYFKELKNVLYEGFMKTFVYVVCGCIAVAVIGGFFVVGSPQTERLRKFDDRRVSDLQFLQSELISYWQNKAVLPGDLSLLRDDIRGVVIPKDPETGVGYGYSIQGPESFSLCATFSLPSVPSGATPVAPYPYGGDSWVHGAGNICFSRTIDKDIYKPRPLVPAIPTKP